MIKQHFREVIRTKTSPNSIALGFAIGTFIAILPTPGISFILGFLVVILFSKVNKFSLFGAIILWNPLITAPINILSYKIGYFLLGDLPVVKYDFALFNHAYNFSRRFLLGNAILSVTISSGSYFLLKNVIKFYQGKHKKEVDQKTI